jgi:hypothetical protein
MDLEITLNQNYITYIDSVDELLTHLKWGVHKKGRNLVYAVHSLHFPHKDLNLKLHRVIMERMLNRVLSEYEIVDHKDGDSLNNRRSNLRLATSAQNAQNSSRHFSNKSGYKGVSFDKGRNCWRSEIMADRVTHRLGRFHTAEDAAIAYNHAALKFHGEFARFNPIDNWRQVNPSPIIRELRSTNTSGVSNISWNNEIQKWKLELRVNGEKKFLGAFATVQEASLAKQAFILELENDN